MDVTGTKPRINLVNEVDAEKVQNQAAKDIVCKCTIGEASGVSIGIQSRYSSFSSFLHQEKEGGEQDPYRS